MQRALALAARRIVSRSTQATHSFTFAGSAASASLVKNSWVQAANDAFAISSRAFSVEQSKANVRDLVEEEEEETDTDMNSEEMQTLAYMNHLGLISFLNMFTSDVFIANPVIVSLFGDKFRPWLCLNELTHMLALNNDFIGHPAASPVPLDHEAAEWDFDGVVTLEDIADAGATQNATINLYYRRRFVTPEDALVIFAKALNHPLDDIESVDRMHPDAKFANLYLTEIVGMVATLEDGSRVVEHFSPALGISQGTPIDTVRTIFEAAEAREIAAQEEAGAVASGENDNEADFPELGEADEEMARNSVICYSLMATLSSNAFLNHPGLASLGDKFFPVRTVSHIAGAGTTGYLSPGMFSPKGPDYDYEMGGDRMKNLVYDGVLTIDNMTSVAEGYENAIVRVYYKLNFDSASSARAIIEKMLSKSKVEMNMDAPEGSIHPLMQISTMYLVSIPAVVLETEDGLVHVNTENPVDFFPNIPIDSLIGIHAGCLERAQEASKLVEQSDLEED